MWRVAVIDDDDSIRALLSRVLQKKFNCLVFEASNGLDGIALLKKERPHLTFLDITMPVMNGIETLKILKNTEDTKNLPVMILSSVNDKHVISHLLSVGITGYMLKPLEVQNVIERITGFFSKQKRTYDGHPMGRVTNTEKSDSVLIVESDLRFRSIMHVLYRTDYNLIETDSGMEALSLILQKEIKYIIIGERIQVINPVALAQKIKSASKTKVSVFLVTEHPERYDLSRLPFESILQKSYMPETMKKELTAKVFGRPDMRIAIVTIISQKMKDDLMPNILEALADSFPGETAAETQSFSGTDRLTVTMEIDVQDTPANLFLSLSVPGAGLDPIGKAKLKTNLTSALGIISMDTINYLSDLSIACAEPVEVQTTPPNENLLDCSFSLPQSGKVQFTVKVV